MVGLQNMDFSKIGVRTITETNSGGQNFKSWKFLKKIKILSIFGLKTGFCCMILLIEVISSTKTDLFLKIESVELAGVELAVCRISRPLVYLVRF